MDVQEQSSRGVSCTDALAKTFSHDNSADAHPHEPHQQRREGGGACHGWSVVVLVGMSFCDLIVEHLPILQHTTVVEETTHGPDPRMAMS